MVDSEHFFPARAWELAVSPVVETILMSEKRDLFEIPQGMKDDVSNAAKLLRGFVSHVDRRMEKNTLLVYLMRSTNPPRASSPKLPELCNNARLRLRSPRSPSRRRI